METFNLFKLPSVALGHVLSTYTIIELLELSTTSKKMARMIPLCGTPRYRISLDLQYRNIVIGNNKIYAFEMDPSKTYDHLRTCRIGNEDVPYQEDEDDENLLVFFWPDKIIGMAKLAMHLSTVFGCKIDEFFSDDLPDAQFWDVIKFLVKQKFPLERLKIAGQDMSRTSLNIIMQDLQIKGELWITSRFPFWFTYTFKKVPSMLRIDKANWFTLKNLMEMTCVRLELQNSSFTNAQLDEYLKAWKEGKFENLQYLEMTSSRFDNQVPIVGMVPPIISTNNHTMPLQLVGKFYAANLPNGVIIEGKNGVKAAMSLVLFENPHKFKMVVFK